MNCQSCGRELRIETENGIRARRACCDERLLKCTKAKRGTPCQHVVQVYVSPYNGSEVISAFCKTHANMDLYDDSFDDEAPPPPQKTKAPPRESKASPEAPAPKAKKEKEPFKSYDPPKYQNWYRRVDLPHYACDGCKIVWATNGPSERCPRCDGTKTRRTGEFTIIDMSRVSFLGEHTETTRVEGDTLVRTNNTKMDGVPIPDVLVLHGYNILTETRPEPEKEP